MYILICNMSLVGHVSITLTSNTRQIPLIVLVLQQRCFRRTTSKKGYSYVLEVSFIYTFPPNHYALCMYRFTKESVI